MEAGEFLADKGRFEEAFGASESLVSDGDGLSIRQFTDSLILITFFICYFNRYLLSISSSKLRAT